MKPTLLILAAGMGSRYGGLKQLDELGPDGETIIDYSVYDAAKAGFGKVVFIIRDSFEDDFRRKVSDKYQGVIEVEHVYQEVNPQFDGKYGALNREKPWGTGHAVLVARDAINEPFAVINADDYYGADGFKKIADFLTQKVSTDYYCMVGYVLNNTLSDHGSVSRGVCLTDENRNLVDVVERTKISRKEGKIVFMVEENEEELNADSIVSMNFWGFHPNVFEHIDRYFTEFVENNLEVPKAEFYIPTFVNRMLKEGIMKMKVLESTEQWYGVTYADDKHMVVNAFQAMSDEGKYSSPLW